MLRRGRKSMTLDPAASLSLNDSSRRAPNSHWEIISTRSLIEKSQSRFFCMALYSPVCPDPRGEGIRVSHQSPGVTGDTKPWLEDLEIFGRSCWWYPRIQARRIPGYFQTLSFCFWSD